LVSFFIRYPWAAGILGLIIALLFANLAIASFREAQRLPSAPQHVSISAAAALAPTSYDQRPWVEIEDGIVDCQNIRYHRIGDSERTEILVSDASKTIVIVVEYSDHLTCQRISQEHPIGLLSRMSDARYERLRELAEFDLSAYEGAVVFMDLCAFCGLGNSRAGVIVGAILAVLGLSLYPLCLIEHRKMYPKRPDPLLSVGPTIRSDDESNEHGAEKKT
jgi:hypothetical protein